MSLADLLNFVPISGAIVLVDDTGGIWGAR
jgi:hypothetical protein